MKPSQFRRIEKKALIQRNVIKGRIQTAILVRDSLGVEEEKGSLNNLVSTMKNLKK